MPQSFIYGNRFIYALFFLILAINMNVDEILSNFLDQDSALNFPIHLGFELKDNYYIRIIYWSNGVPVKFGYDILLYEFDLLNLEIKKNQKKSIVKHLMRRLKFKFSFNLYEEDDRYYIKKIEGFYELKNLLLKLYSLIDQQIGLSDKSKPKVFFE